MSTTDPLAGFSEPTRAWFASNFVAPTPAQTGAWDALRRRQHTLVVAPTGSGKTLAAFLSAVDALTSTPPPGDPRRRCRVLYLSPLKALAADVERNLRSPLTGIGHAAARLGLPVPEVSVAVRTGDTPAPERRRFATHPSDILITTPESLFLMMTSAAREGLRGVETVILDEVHALAGTKRGAHLALTLERLDALLEQPAIRVGLSATVRPVEEVARYLAGGRPVSVVAPPSSKSWELDVVVPVPDMTDIPVLEGHEADPQQGTSIWPHVEERIVDLVAQQRSTLIFCNSRRLAERLTSRLNEIWDERQHPAAAPSVEKRPPATIMTSGRAAGAPPVLARAHHGSVSREQRLEIEEELKSGRLPAVVATSSLELGIDMGAVDLVIQVEAPPSVASGLQRVGRAGHQVGAVSHGVLFPKFRQDLVSTAVVVERMREGAIEELRIPANPVDVLAQQIVAMCAMDDWSVADLASLVRRCASYATLPDSILTATLDMLAGRYPSDEFADLKPRIVWDRVHDVLTGRPGAQRLAIVSGGTIPDRGLFGVFLAGADGPGRRVGELDEEMVYESRVGDVFALGSTSWRIEEITHDRVLVTPAPGMPARLPFWRGDQLGRPAELGRAIGAFVRQVGTGSDGARERVAKGGLDPWATDNLLAYLAEQRAAIPQLPTDTTLVLERFRDELGDWRVCLHSPYGAPVHAPWSLAIGALLRKRLGMDVDATPSDDGIVIRVPDLGNGGSEPAWLRELGEIIAIDPDDITDLVTAELGGSAVFAARFRECAARALLLPRRRPDRRQALWQQRQRSAQLLEVAGAHPDFPIVLEAVRECLHDVFDLPALADLLSRLRSRQVRLVEAATATPSPFARGLAFGYVAHYLYEGDSPLAERRAAALSLDPTLLAELIGHGEAAGLRDLLDPGAVREVAAQLQRLVPEDAARDAEDIADLLRVLGPLSLDALEARSVEGADIAAWLASLVQQRRTIQLRMAGETRWAVVEDAARLRDALGVQIPLGVAESLLVPVADPLPSLLRRYARTHIPFTAEGAAAELGLGVGIVRPALQRLVAERALVVGELLPPELARGHEEYCDAEVLRRLKRRSLAALRREVEPVEQYVLARFLPRWHGIADPPSGPEAVVTAIEHLAGARVPASAWETLVLPARVRDYTPSMLDELVATGEVTWQGHSPLGRDDGWVSFHLADTAPLTLAAPDLSDLTDAQRSLLEQLGPGARLASSLTVADSGSLVDDLWALIWAGAVTSDTLAPLRALLARGRPAHSMRRTSRTRSARLGALRHYSARQATVVPPRVAGRWVRLPELEPDETVRRWAAAEVLLERYGIVTRGCLEAEESPGGFAATYRLLRAAEEAGRIRRGYFVEGLGAAQFAVPGAVDRLRALAHQRVDHDSPLAHLTGERGPRDDIVLAACDPANPWGAALAWPPHEGGHRPGRKAGAVVVAVDGELVLYVERGGRTLLSFSDNPTSLARAAESLAAAVRRGALGTLSVEKADGSAVLGADTALVCALEGAGFRLTPRGLRLRGPGA